MPEPILVSIAAALAGKGASSLYDLVKKKLSGSPEATATLERVRDEGVDSAHLPALSDELARAERADPGFAADLRSLWNQTAVQQNAAQDGVTNQITGTVSGKVLQARDIHGDITF